MAQRARAATPPDDGRVGDLLQRLVLTSSRLLHGTAGSISLVDATGDRYAAPSYDVEAA
jgi:hypothetical protein